MGDNLSNLRGKSIRKLNKLTKITLIIFIGLFFSVYFGIKNSSLAEAPSGLNKKYSEIDFGKFDPLWRIKKRAFENVQEKKEKLVKEKRNELVSGYPIEEMLPYIDKYGPQVASFLIAIAKKESDWGQYSPKKDEEDCFNYWGYRGTENQTTSGYSCFDNPKQAIDVVGGRIQRLLENKIDTPEKMILWKCGSSCPKQGSSDVQNWIANVRLYYEKWNS